MRKMFIMLLIIILSALMSYGTFAAETGSYNDAVVESDQHSDLEPLALNYTSEADSLSEELQSEYPEEVLEGYKDLTEYISQNGITAEISLETFLLNI